jgi:multicomponent K+:H+ antiporter subunit E
MSRLLPYPLLSLLVVAAWLLLNQTVELAHVALGGALGVGASLLLAWLQPPAGRVRRRVATAAALLGLVFLDIVRSNVAVGSIVFHPRIRGRTSGFLTMPLELRHPGGLAALACIITATPGTSWARYDAARNRLTIHVLDLVDEAAWIRLFKQRYERRLLEIFQ